MGTSLWSTILATSIVLLVMLFLIIVIYYFVSAKGMKKRKTHFENLHTSLAKGQMVVFSNGIYGTIQQVGEETVDIQVKSGATMTVSRYAISEIVKKQPR